MKSINEHLINSKLPFSFLLFCDYHYILKNRNKRGNKNKRITLKLHILIEVSLMATCFTTSSLTQWLSSINQHKALNNVSNSPYHWLYRLYWGCYFLTSSTFLYVQRAILQKEVIKANFQQVQRLEISFIAQRLKF